MVIYHTHCNLIPCLIQQQHGIAETKPASYFYHTRGQKALSLFQNSPFSTPVNNYFSLGRLSKGYPVLSAAESCLPGQKQRTFFFPREYQIQDTRFQPIGNDGRYPAEGNFAGRLDLAGHSAGSQKTRDRTGISHYLSVRLFNHINEFGIVVVSGVFVKKPVNIGEIYQELRLGQIGHHGAEVVIISKFDLVHHNSIILIDNRDDVP